MLSPFIKNIIRHQGLESGVFKVGGDLSAVVGGVVYNVEQNIFDTVLKGLSFAVGVRDGGI